MEPTAAPQGLLKHKTKMTIVSKLGCSVKKKEENLYEIFAGFEFDARNTFEKVGQGHV